MSEKIPNPIRSEVIILEYLREHAESHGYEIMRWVQQVTRNQIGFGAGTLYPTLEKLADPKFGLIRETRTELAGSPRGRLRKYYSLTEAGRERANLNRRIIAVLTNFSYEGEE